MNLSEKIIAKFRRGIKKMDNTWFYTLSTIAQTLAAILGLAAIFVTIRLQNIILELKEYKRRAYYIIKIRDRHLSKDLKDYRITDRTASGLFKDLQEMEKNYMKYEENSGIKADLEKFAKAFEQNLDLDNLSFLKDTAGYLYFYIKQRKQLLKSIKWPGIISSGTIIFTIFLLSISKLFYCDRIFAIQLFTLAVIFSILSMLLIIDASWKLFKDSAEKL